MKRLLFLVPVLTLIASAASAIPYKGNKIYKTTWQGNSYLILSGTPTQTQEFYLNSTTDSYKFVGTDVCGWAKVKLPDGVTISNFKVNGITVNPYAAPSTQTVYNCNTTYGEASLSGSSAYNANIKTYYWKGSAAHQSVKFDWIQPTRKIAKYNNCGFYQLKFESGSLVINGVTYNFTSLPQAPYPPLCRSVGTTQVPYAPSSYN
jgi:hypothetical protein